MSEFSDMLERIKIDEVIAFLMYGADSIIEHSGTYEERIKNAYDDIFDKLEKMFPSASRKDDELHGAVLDFSIVIMRFILKWVLLLVSRCIRTWNRDFEVSGMEKIIKKNFSADKEAEERPEEKASVLQAIIDEGINYTLETSLRTDEKYKDARKMADETLDDIDGIGLDKKQWKTVDRAVSAANALGAEYGRAAYEQGVKDSVKLLAELHGLL